MAKTNYSTYLAIKRKILDIFKTQTFKNNKLPPESKMAEQFGVSLVTLREALMMLALEGYITKQHGSGNYIHPSALDYENRSYYFIQCLKKDGYDADIEVLEQSWVEADERQASFLKVDIGDKLLRTNVLYRADKEPAILSEGYIPAKNLIRKDIENMNFHEVHVLMQEFCGKYLAHALNEYIPMAVPEKYADLFGLSTGTPIIGIEQVFYSIEDEPILYSEHYIYPNRYKIRTLQNWALSD